MGVRTNTSYFIGTPGVQTNNALETVLALLGPLSLPLDNAVVQIFWYMQPTFGTSATACIARVRRGSATVGSTGPSGTIINLPTGLTGAAGNVINVAGLCTDSPGVGGDLFYIVTLQMTSQSVAANVNDVQAFAMVL
jgi:hypothetical protein